MSMLISSVLAFKPEKSCAKGSRENYLCLGVIYL